MRADGSVPVYDNYGAVQFDQATDDDLEEVRTTGIAASKRSARGVPSRLDAWRRDNADALQTWETKYGCVVLFWGMKVYYGRCRACPEIVTSRRNANTRGGGAGRWPELCNECRARKSDQDANSARRRMARLRRERYTFRSEQYAKIGLPEPRQGVPGWEAEQQRREKREAEDW